MTSRLLLVATAAVIAIGAGAASAADHVSGGAPTSSHAKGQCFQSRWWDGSWHAPDSSTIYMKVMGDIWRVELSAGAQMLTDPTAHLINVVRGPDTVCTAQDLDLRVSNGFGPIPVTAKSLVKLTPEEVAQIPKKDRP
jgi:hypothetical protein